MNRTENRTLLVALGNPLNGDDGFGPQVLERLHEAADALPPGVELVDAGTDLLNHIESFAGRDRVVLIDAVLDPEGKLGSAGTVAVMDEESFQSWSETSQSVHQVSPLLGLKLFRALNPEAKTQIFLVGLLVDQISQKPRYLTEDRIRQAIAYIKTATNFTN